MMAAISKQVIADDESMISDVDSLQAPYFGPKNEEKPFKSLKLDQLSLVNCLLFGIFGIPHDQSLTKLNPS